MSAADAGAKRPRREPASAFGVAKPLASTPSVVAQLCAPDGSATGPLLDLPADVTPPQLEALLHSLLRDGEANPYAFYVGGRELTAGLAAHLAETDASVEGTLRITYKARGERSEGAPTLGVGGLGGRGVGLLAGGCCAPGRLTPPTPPPRAAASAVPCGARDAVHVRAGGPLGGCAVRAV